MYKFQFGKFHVIAIVVLLVLTAIVALSSSYLNQPALIAGGDWIGQTQGRLLAGGDWIGQVQGRLLAGGDWIGQVQGRLLAGGDWIGNHS